MQPDASNEGASARRLALRDYFAAAVAGAVGAAFLAALLIGGLLVLVLSSEQQDDERWLSGSFLSVLIAGPVGAGVALVLARWRRHRT